MLELNLIGHPVAQSKSPEIHNAVFSQVGADMRFGKIDFPVSADAEAYLRDGDYLGLSVTTPYKPLAMRCVDVCAASAKLAKGANIVVTVNGKHLGYNIDGRGLVSYLEYNGIDFAGKTVVVCGTGPTSHSCYHAAAIAGADTVVMISRVKERAQEAVEEYLELFGTLAHATIDLPPEDEGHRSFREAYDETRFMFGSYETSKKIIGAADIIIDATTLGMKPDDPAPFDCALLSTGQTVFDVIYARETAFLAAAKARGCTVFDGRAMLLGQAVLCQRMWLDAAGVETDLSWRDMVDIMTRAAGFVQ